MSETEILTKEQWDWFAKIARPCHVCGSTEECSYDSEGRPMIHTYVIGNELYEEQLTQLEGARSTE